MTPRNAGHRRSAPCVGRPAKPAPRSLSAAATGLGLGAPNAAGYRSSTGCLGSSLSAARRKLNVANGTGASRWDTATRPSAVRQIGRELERLANCRHQVVLSCGFDAEGRRARGECRLDIPWLIARGEHHTLQPRAQLMRPPKALDHVKISVSRPVANKQDVRDPASLRDQAPRLCRSSCRRRESLLDRVGAPPPRATRTMALPHSSPSKRAASQSIMAGLSIDYVTGVLSLFCPESRNTRPLRPQLSQNPPSNLRGLR